jgi:DNA helicase-2/ATP-dependent DNA helicase PcrA
MTLSENKFEAEYKKLNPEQKKAVDAIDGPVMVIAGPGTGKTQILTLRIANILKKTDTAPESILALTFTESGVASMRGRLAEMIGSPAYRVNISTFHGFANNIIRNYPEEFPYIIGADSITDVEQYKLMQEIIINSELSVLRPFGDTFYYLRPALATINKLKQEGIVPERFSKLIDAEQKKFDAIDDLYYDKGAHKGKMKGKYQDLLKHITKNRELCVLYSAYHELLREKKLYDYSDMINEVSEVLEKNKDFLLTLQEKYQYFLIDEHQDTNNAQNRIIELLANYYENPNVFMVGDDKQAIFRFQGASLENFLYFKNRFKGAKVITLTDNYRSSQSILDLAHSLMKKGELQAKAKHTSKKIPLYIFSSTDTELFFLADNIKEKISKGIKPEDIAVLYRDNADVMPIASMMEKLGVPFRIESDQNVLEDEDIKKLMIVLRVIENFGEPAPLYEMLHIDFIGVEPLDVYKLIEYSRRLRINPYDVIRSEKHLKEAGIDGNARLKELYGHLSGWKTISQNMGAADVFEIIVRESGFLSHLLSNNDPFGKIEKLRSLFDQIKALIEKKKDYKLGEFMEYLDMLIEHRIMLKNSGPHVKPGKVRLMTAHKSKGLEFDYVYIAHLFDGHWGNKRHTEHFKIPDSVYKIDSALEENENQDDRNLFYVALTRAKKEIVLSYSKQSLNGREQLACQFIDEMDGAILEKGDASEYEAKFAGNQEILFAESKISEIGIKDKEFLNSLFEKYGLSVTALNNYLECPWRYFYSNLVRIPEAPNKHLMYGNAVHQALKDFFDKFSEKDPGPEYLVRRFEEELASQPIEKEEYKEALAKGHKCLPAFYKQYHSEWRKNFLSEFKIDGIELAPGLKINGKLDKLEILDSSNNVNVVDYKTGKPKSRNVIAGKTASSDGDYKRQLVFYALLLKNFNKGKYKMASGEIDFVEPDQKGVFKKESFIISEDEIIEIEKVIRSVAGEIRELSFWDKFCDDSDCHHCNMRRMIKDRQE